MSWAANRWLSGIATEMSTPPTNLPTTKAHVEAARDRLARLAFFSSATSDRWLLGFIPSSTIYGLLFFATFFATLRGTGTTGFVASTAGISAEGTGRR